MRSSAGHVLLIKLTKVVLFQPTFQCQRIQPLNHRATASFSILAHQLYGSNRISERHRHRYEVNNDFREKLQEMGMVISGVSPDYRLVEMVELTEHPYFIATQAHPEFKSRPNRPAPLFTGLVKAAVERKSAVGV